jgi:endonuclease/exonuclease/phosphatase (EEP) superfamily protein YafD
LTLAGFAGTLAWYCDLASYFRVQYALILGLTALAAALLRRVRTAGLALTLAVTNLAVVAPAWNGAERSQTEALELTILLLNLDAGNDDLATVAELLGERRPDLFAAVELTPAWARGLETSLAPYRSRLLAPRSSRWGLGLYARRELSDTAVLLPAGQRYPVLVATVEGASEPIRLALLHPAVPSTSGLAARHERFLSLAGASIRAAKSGIVLGDLNTTPWSAGYRELLEEAGLEDTREGYGLQTTWPSFLPAALRIPVDHVLVTPDLAAADRQVGPEVGSDHLPVWVELAARAGSS